MDTTTDPAAHPDPDPDVVARADPDGSVLSDEGPVGVGDHGETLAAEHLASLGLEVVARNWRVNDGDLRGELDLVALDHAEGCVVVVEVKTRRGGGWGGPLAAIDGRKQARLRRLARAFMTQADLPYRRSRIDVVGVRLDTRHLHHVTHAL